jgi:hypothetical protein
VGRFNDLQFRYGGYGLQVVSANYVNSDSEIDAFDSAYGVRYGLARVADASGFNVPSFGTVFAIGRNAKLLWTGSIDDVTDSMVEQWLARPWGPPETDEESCSTSPRHGLPLLLGLLAALTSATRLRRGPAFDAAIHLTNR